MNENRGVRCRIDKPIHGDEYVDRTDDTHCLGFYETKSHNGKDINQTHIEK